MVTDNGNDRDGRDGYSSSEDNSNEPVKKKRTRVGDLRKQAYDVDQGSRERNPYKADGDRQGSSYGSDRSPRSYDRNDNSERRSYNNNQSRPSGNRSGYSDNRGGGYSDRGGYSDNRGGGYSDNRGGYSDNRGGGYSDNRSGGYSNNRGGNNSRGNSYGNRSNDNRRPSNNNRGGGGFSRPSSGGDKRLVKPVKYKENIDPNTPLRLNKYLANAGVCSRREADAFITSGVVKVNGVVVDQLGAKVTRGDLVTFQDKPVRLESKVYVLLNKPKNCVTTSDDPQNRLTVMDLVKNACPERIYPVGRLDRNTTGVLLLTNDGDLASKLMHPKFKKKKIYQVTLDRDVAIEDMQAIADGIDLDDGEIHADSIAYQSEDALNVVGIEIHSGRNRIVRRIFEKLGYQVMKLDRVYFAGLTKKNVVRGKWRYLSEKEVNMLRMGAFE
ncbi:MAG: pseudouridine synthase [Dysgonomonas sp.]